MQNKGTYQMPSKGTYNAGGDTGTVMPIGDHPCRIVSIEETEGKDYNTGEPIDQYKIKFEHLTKRDGDGKPFVLTLWTGQNYGNEKAWLTKFVDGIFGRALTYAEWQALDFDRLVGLEGMVLVAPHKKQDGTQTTKFAAFRPRPDRPAPLPANYGEVTASAARTPQPKAVTPPTPDGEIENPWGSDGTGADAPF